MPTQSLEYKRFLAWQDDMRDQLKSPFQRFLERLSQKAAKRLGGSRLTGSH